MMRQSSSVLFGWLLPRLALIRRQKSATLTLSHCCVVTSLLVPATAASSPSVSGPCCLFPHRPAVSLLCARHRPSSASRLTLCVMAVLHTPTCTWVRQSSTCCTEAGGDRTGQLACTCSREQQRSLHPAVELARHYQRGLQIRWVSHLWSGLLSIAAPVIVVGSCSSVVVELSSSILVTSSLIAPRHVVSPSSSSLLLRLSLARRSSPRSTTPSRGLGLELFSPLACCPRPPPPSTQSQGGAGLVIHSRIQTVDHLSHSLCHHLTSSPSSE